jgi:multidrug efflux system outer membrane protein
LTPGGTAGCRVERAQANYDSSNADIQDLRRAIALEENAISTLVGAYPRAIERGRPLTEQSAPETPLGSTTALLQRRPDILQAEQGMISANAEIGVSVANFFPKVGLSAFLGGQGMVSGNRAGFGLWNIALSAAGSIYSGGRLQAVYQERQAYWDEDCRAVQTDGDRRISRNIRRACGAGDLGGAAHRAREPGWLPQRSSNSR